jgi:hypothetical protein
MSGIEGAQVQGDVEESEEGLLNVARAVWQARWLVPVCLLGGAILGFWHESRQAEFRTTMTLRWRSSNISYLYRSYWDYAAKIRAGQLNGILSAHPQAGRLALRTEPDPWIVRLEVLHDGPGQGKLVGEELLQSLRVLDQRTVSDGALSERQKAGFRDLQKTLGELETLLRTLPEAPTMPGYVASGAQLTRLNQQFTSESGPRIPLDNLPLFPWYQSLQIRSSNVLAQAASERNLLEAAEQLAALQQRAVQQLVQFWWSMDLLVSAGPMPDFGLEAVSEQKLSSLSRSLQSASIGMWICGLLGVLLAVPFRWLRSNWQAIVESERPAGTARD